MKSSLKPHSHQETDLYRESPAIHWKLSDGLIPYDNAITEMKAMVQDIQKGLLPTTIWMLEHPPILTLGTSAKASDILHHQFPYYKTGRGGEVTYHGPGQRIIYVMMNLEDYKKDIRWFIYSLEEWVIQTLALLGLDVFRRDGRVGLWVPDTKTRDKKIAAIGVRVSKWVTFHGLALNINPDLSHYEGIVPCGIREHGITSLAEQGIQTSFQEIDLLFQKTFHDVFYCQI